MDRRLDRAQGCLLGQLIGDSLGSLVEFQSQEQIARSYPDGVRELADGGTWSTIAGQPTDDSELALVPARTLVELGTYDQSAVRAVYVDWLSSRPFDVGNTVRAGLQGTPNFESEANGALMRVSPLGIFSSGIDRELAARFAREDAWITHPHEIPQDANVVIVFAIADAIWNGLDSLGTFRRAREFSDQHGLNNMVAQAVTGAAEGPPERYDRHIGLGASRSAKRILSAPACRVLRSSVSRYCRPRWGYRYQRGNLRGTSWSRLWSLWHTRSLG